MLKFYSLQIKEIHRETPMAVSLLFDIPEDIRGEFEFKAGQYVTLKTIIDGAEVRRSYSLSSSPTSGEWRVVVKEVEGGLFSTHVNRKLQKGDILEVSKPEGRFVFQEDSKNMIAFAAGSGITPVFSIIQQALENTTCKIVLVYGNQSPKTTIFGDELMQLQRDYGSRLMIHWVYSREQNEQALFGRIDRAIMNFILKKYYANTSFDAYYICGPEVMINTIEQCLLERKVGKEKILREYFSVSQSSDDAKTLAPFETKLSIILEEEEYELSMEAKETILSAALRQGIDAPFSCQGGVCSSCIARLVTGQVVMDKNQILTDGELAQGFILTCQAHPTTDSVTVDYDDV